MRSTSVPSSAKASLTSTVAPCAGTAATASRAIESAGAIARIPRNTGGAYSRARRAVPSTGMKVTLPDGTPLELSDGATGADAARAIGEGLARAALGVRQNGDLLDLDAPLEEGPLEIVTARDSDGLWLIRHDAAHVLATAVMELYPGVKISIGPPIDDGFYYDFEFPDGRQGLRR